MLHSKAQTPVLHLAANNKSFVNSLLYGNFIHIDNNIAYLLLRENFEVVYQLVEKRAEK